MDYKSMLLAMLRSFGLALTAHLKSRKNRLALVAGLMTWIGHENGVPMGLIVALDGVIGAAILGTAIEDGAEKGAK